MELLPCPFCGGEAEAYNCGPWLRDHFMWYVKCSDCSSLTPNKPTEAEAAAAWNTRHEEIVRCRDCVFFDDMSFTLKGHTYRNYICTRRKERDDEVDMTDPDGFCAWGEGEVEG